jgi:hypothetical protein
LGRRRKVEAAEKSFDGDRVWLKAEIEFAGAFSYRQPDASAQFVIGSPIPSPATVKLTLVDTAIRWNNSVEIGRQVFDWLKTCKVHCVPPAQVIRFRVFLKRLKPEEVVACPNHPDFTVSAKSSKEKRPPCPHCGSSLTLKAKSLEGSTGIRDYFLLDDCLTIYLQVPADKVEVVRQLLLKVRRLGTSDSLCWCRDVREIEESELPHEFFARKLEELPESALRQGITQGMLVARLSDLTERSEFDGFNPFGGNPRWANLEKASYLLPLRMERYGETWALLKRVTLPR